MRIWIKNYSAIARPLVDLTRKDTDFVWEEQHDQAMQELKDAVVNLPVLIPIDYKSSRPVFLAIDSSWCAVGWILSQQCEDGQCRPSHFGSIACVTTPLFPSLFPSFLIACPIPVLAMAGLEPARLILTPRLAS